MVNLLNTGYWHESAGGAALTTRTVAAAFCIGSHFHVRAP
jgi:hypothetical protein